MHPTLVRNDIRYWRLTPDARLRPHVLCYFVALPPDGKQERTCDEELLLPDGHGEIVFVLSGGFERWAVGSTERQIMRPSYLIGGRSHSVLTRAIDNLVVVGAKLDCRVLRDIIRTPLAEFRDGTLPLRDLKHQPLLDLEDAIANASSVERIRDSFDQFFLRALGKVPTGDAAVNALLHRLRKQHGVLPIMEWIRSNGLDARSFERRFCAWTGMTPKRYARVVRFKESYRRFISGTRARGALAAHLDGYYDQSHFAREYKYFTGLALGAKVPIEQRPATGVTDHLLEGEEVWG